MIEPIKGILDSSFRRSKCIMVLYLLLGHYIHAIPCCPAMTFHISSSAYRSNSTSKQYIYPCRNRNNHFADTVCCLDAALCTKQCSIASGSQATPQSSPLFVVISTNRFSWTGRYCTRIIALATEPKQIHKSIPDELTETPTWICKGDLGSFGVAQSMPDSRYGDHHNGADRSDDYRPEDRRLLN
jgi:hypothetical protein